MRLRKQFLCLLLAALLLALTVPAGVFVTHAAQTGEVTRAQWIEALVDTFAMTVDADNYPDNYYSDISEKDSFYRDIMVAVEFGVIDLEAGLAFEPNAPATREFAAHTLNFCLGYQLDADAVYSFSEAQTVTYPDDIQVAVNRGWFALSGNSFKPENAITAAEKQKMLADAKAVLAADQLAEDYTNSYQFADGVKVLPENTVFTQESETVYIISSPAKSIAKGDLFVLFDDDVPVVCKAEAVSVSQKDYTVTVSHQNINDYLLSMDAQGSTVGDLKEFQVADEVDALYVLEDGTRVKDVKASGTKKIKAIYFSGQISNLSVAIELYDMKLDWQAKGNVLNPSSIKVKAIVTGKTFCNASLAFGASVSDYTGPLTLGYCPIGSLGSVTVTANISVDGCITVSYGANFKTGVEYTYSGGFRIPQTFQKTHFSLTVEATLDMSVTARASITNIPLLSAQCYATVGIKANFVARYRGADKDPALCLHTDTWLYAKIGASATVGFSSEKFQKSWRTDLTIWDRNTSPARSVSHFEDGTRVSSCAYGETNFFGYNSYYWSSLASRYGNGGVSAVANVPTYTYTTDKDGNATITGYSGGFAALSLPATIDGHKVVTIGENAFKNHKELVTVTIPASVTVIGKNAFRDCTGLRNLYLPNGLLTIGNGSFCNCSQLLRVEIPDTVTTVDSGAFEACKSLAWVKMSRNLVTIGYSAFKGTAISEIFIPKTLETCHSHYNGAGAGTFSDCPNLKTITIEEGLAVIPANLFRGCQSIETITIPNSVTRIREVAFERTGLTEIVIPDSVTIIDNNAFVDCVQLTKVTMSKKLVTIGYSAFRGTAISEIFIPKTLETCHSHYNGADAGTFSNCPNLKTVTLEEGLMTIPANLLRGCKSLETITIPDTVTRIGGVAFERSGLKEIVIPDSVVTIDNDAFLYCEQLTKVTMSKKLVTLGYGAFRGTAISEIFIPKTLKTCNSHFNGADMGAFNDCFKLKTVTLEAGIERVPNNLLRGCDGIEEIVIPDSVGVIGEYAFEYCPSLKKIQIPASVHTIEKRAFEGTGFTEFTVPDTVTAMYEYVFSNCDKLEKATIQKTRENLMAGTFQDCDALKEVILPEGLQYIRENALRNCDALVSITIPGKVLGIDNCAFYDCDALKEIVIPDSVTYLGNEVFRDCDALTKVTMGNSVKTVGNNSFRHCDMLKDVTLSQLLSEIAWDSFRECAELEQIVIPYSVTAIGDNAFAASPKLTKVVTGKKLAKISTSAFSYANKTVFYGIADSYTQSWAAENGYQFVVNSTPATSISLSCETLELVKGATAQLIVNVAPLDFSDAVIFKTNKTDVVTVSESGEVKAVGVGTATIKVTAGNVSVSCKVTVSQAVSRVSLNKTNLSLELPATYQLTATVTPNDASNQTLSWTSSDESVATVDQTGLVTGIGNGTAVITAAAQDGSGKTATCTVTVVDPNNIPVQSVSIVYKGGDLQGLDIVQLTAGVFPGNAANKKLLWTSSDETVATVDENGVVTALKKGTVTITATAADGYGASGSVTVTVISDGYVVTDPAQLESPHNYLVSCTDGWKYTMPGSVALEITFDDRTDIEDGFDYLHIYNGAGNLVGTYTGTELAGKTITVPGDTVVIRLQSDDSGTAWGFKVTQVKAAEGLKGDFDGNGMVSVDDAIYLLQHVLMPGLFPVTQSGDVDHSGGVSVDDAIYLLQHVLMPGLFPLT